MSNGARNATIMLILGFLVFLLGILALILMLVGVQFSFLKWIDAGGQTLGLVIRLMMIFGGIVVVYVYRNKFEK